MADQKKEPAAGKKLSKNSMVQLGIMLVLILGIVITALTCIEGNTLLLFTWIFVILAPYGVLMLAGFRCNGLPKLFQTRAFIIVYMILMALTWIFMPWILEILVFVYIGLAALALLRVFAFFGPSGFIDVTTTDHDGRVTHETIPVYGDVESEARRLEIELSDRKGHTEIKTR